MKKHILLYVEGDTEDVLFPAIIKYYRQTFECADVVFHIENIQGIGNYKSRAKGKLKKLSQDIKKKNEILKVVLCSYDTDVFEFASNPPINWVGLKKDFENITGKKNVTLIPIKHSIEDWLLSDIDGLCKYLRTKKKPRRLPGKNGYEKITHWFRQHNKVYYKGYDSKEIMKHIDIAKITAKYSIELTPIRKALGIE